MKKYPVDFIKWTTQMVEDAFGLKRTKSNAFLTEWLNCDTPVTDDEKAAALRLQENAQDRIAYWNESDVKEWYFLVLQGKEYAVSRTFLLIEPDGIIGVVQKMKCLKTILDKRM